MLVCLWLGLFQFLFQFILTTEAHLSPHPKVITKNVNKCPGRGHFYETQNLSNSQSPHPCYLWFCRDAGKATCWLKEERICKTTDNHEDYNRASKTRVARSVVFDNVFMRDAAREFFNRQHPVQCKPFQSRISYGCPPEDLCIGCTICDCDANGFWDCRLISACPNKEKLKLSNLRRNFRGEVRSSTKLIRISSSNLTKSTQSTAQKRKTTKHPKKAVPKKNRSNNYFILVKKNLTEKGPMSLKGIKGKLGININNYTNVYGHQYISTKRKTSHAQNKTPISASGNNGRASDFTSRIKRYFYKEKAKRHKLAINNKKASSKLLNEKPNKRSKNNNSTKFVVRNKRNVKETSTKPTQISREMLVKNDKEDANLLENNALSIYKLQKYDSTERSLLNKVKNKLYDLSTHLERYYYRTDEDGSSDKLVKNYSNSKTKQSTEDIQFPQYVVGHKYLNFSQRTQYKDFMQSIRNVLVPQPRDIKLQEKNGKKYNNYIGFMERKRYPNKKINNNHINEVVNMLQEERNKEKNYIIKYMKRFLKRMLWKTAQRNNFGIKSKGTYFDIKNLCLASEICSGSKRIKNIYESKIIDLNFEVDQILRAVRKIKLQLRFFDDCFDGSNHFGSINYNKKGNVTKDMQIIIAILKGTYFNSEKRQLLNECLKSQIKKIKANIVSFIFSVHRFALILDEVIDLLVIKPKKPIAALKNKRKIEHIPSSKKFEYKYLKDYFRMLHDMFSKFSMLQNTFIKSMIQSLLEIETKIPTPKDVIDIKRSKIYDDIYYTELAFQNYSKSILDNMEKLEKLTTILKNKRRIKREIESTGSDETLENILMLMEYLLLHHYNLKSAPVNDGIDLILEAIQNAPDIKSIKEKVLRKYFMKNSFISKDNKFCASGHSPDSQNSSNDENNSSAVQFTRNDKTKDSHLEGNTNILNKNGDLDSVNQLYTDRLYPVKVLKLSGRNLFNFEKSEHTINQKVFDAIPFDIEKNFTTIATSSKNQEANILTTTNTFINTISNNEIYDDITTQETTENYENIATTTIGISKEAMAKNLLHQGDESSVKYYKPVSDIENAKSNWLIGDVWDDSFVTITTEKLVIDDYSEISETRKPELILLERDMDKRMITEEIRDEEKPNHEKEELIFNKQMNTVGYIHDLTENSDLVDSVNSKHIDRYSNDYAS